MRQIFRLLLIVTVLASPVVAQAVTHSSVADPAVARLFSARDALGINTYAIADMTEDGRWVALTHSVRRDAFGTDYRRDGDPTYVRVTPVQLWAVEARTGQRTPVFAGKRPVRGMRWS